MHKLSRILKNAIFLYSSFSVSQIINLLVTFYLARIFSPENYGKLNFSFTLANYFSLFNLTGFSILGLRWIATAKDNQERKLQIRDLVSVRTMLSFLAFLLLCIFLLFFRSTFEIKYLIFLFGLVILVSNLSLGWIFQGIQRMELSEIPGIITSIIYMNLIFLLIKSDAHLIRVPLIGLWTYLLLFLITAIILHRLFGRIEIDLNLNFLKNNLKTALIFSVFPVLCYMVNNLEKLLLGFMSDNQQVGYYFAAYRIFYLLYSLIIPFYSAIFPALSYYYRYNWETFKKLCNSTVNFMFILSFPITIFIFLSAGPIINFVYRFRYFPSIPILQILIINLILIYINSFFTQGLLSAEKEDRVVFGLVVQTLFIFIFCIFFIPKMGARAASLSQVFGQLITFFIYYKEFNKVLKTPLMKFIWRPFLASLIMTVSFIIYMGRNLIFSFLGAFSIYIVVLSLLGGFPWDEIKMIWEAVKINKNR